MSSPDILLLTGAASLLGSAAVLLTSAVFTWWRDFGARPQARHSTTPHHVTQIPHYA